MAEEQSTVSLLSIQIKDNRNTRHQLQYSLDTLLEGERQFEN